MLTKLQNVLSTLRGLESNRPERQATVLSFSIGTGWGSGYDSTLHVLVYFRDISFIPGDIDRRLAGIPAAIERDRAHARDGVAELAQEFSWLQDWLPQVRMEGVLDAGLRADLFTWLSIGCFPIRLYPPNAPPFTEDGVTGWLSGRSSTTSHTNYDPFSPKGTRWQG